MKELLKARALVNVDVQDCFKRALALGELVHRRKVDRIPPKDVVLLSQDFTVASQDVSGVLLEETLQPKVELSVSLDGISIVGNVFSKLSLLDVHRLHSEPAFLLLKLIVHNFLKAHSFETKKRHQAVKLPSVADNVVAIQTLIVDVQLVENLVTWRAFFELQVARNVHESEMAERVKGGKMDAYQAMSSGVRPAWSRWLINLRISY